MDRLTTSPPSLAEIYATIAALFPEAVSVTMNVSHGEITAKPEYLATYGDVKPCTLAGRMCGDIDIWEG